MSEKTALLLSKRHSLLLLHRVLPVRKLVAGEEPSHRGEGPACFLGQLGVAQQHGLSRSGACQPADRAALQADPKPALTLPSSHSTGVVKK